MAMRNALETASPTIAVTTGSGQSACAAPPGRDESALPARSKLTRHWPAILQVVGARLYSIFRVWSSSGGIVKVARASVRIWANKFDRFAELSDE
jgi:hypothetical protein